MALINQGKYGVGIWDNVLSLSLLRAPCRPDLAADRGRHQFCYLILPHKGTAVEAGVNRTALMYNHPLRQWDLPPLNLPCDPALHLMAVKKYEDGDGIIVRLCETEGRRGVLRFPGPVESMDMLETRVLSVSDAVPYAPFQILTIHIATK